MRVLVIEDDQVLCNTLRKHIETAGFAVDIAFNGQDGLEMGGDGLYAAVVLDLGLPKLNGLGVLKRWRERRNHVPVIILTARNDWHERVAGIEAGADDYMGKPFHTEELLARLKALIRRTQSRRQGLITGAALTLDEHRQTVVTPEGDSLPLTGTEFRLLRCFMLNADRILSLDTLMNHIYDNDTINDHNVIEVYVGRLRKKLGRKRIKTHRGQGYSFVTSHVSGTDRKEK